MKELNINEVSHVSGGLVLDAAIGGIGAVMGTAIGGIVDVGYATIGLSSVKARLKLSPVLVRALT